MSSPARRPITVLGGTTRLIPDGVSPPVYPEGRRCIWPGCGVLLNTYNGREYCLLHDHKVDHTHRPIGDEDGKMVLRALLRRSGQWVSLKIVFPEWDSKRLNRAIDIVERAGYYIEGRKARKGNPAGHRVLM